MHTRHGFSNCPNTCVEEKKARSGDSLAFSGFRKEKALATTLETPQTSGQKDKHWD